MKFAAFFVGGLVLTALAAFGVYSAYDQAFPSGTLRYRLTLEVEVDGKIEVGSSVIEARYEIPPRWMLGANRIVTTVRGEAVTVDLRSRGILCVLLIGVPAVSPGDYIADADAMPLREFALASSIGGLEESTLKRLHTLRARSEVAFPSLPMLVWFRDPNDPKTVELVPPTGLEKQVGSGVHLKRVTIESTSDHVTTGIEGKLPWLPKRKGVPGTITGAPLLTPNRPELNLTGIEFSTELFR